MNVKMTSLKTETDTPLGIGIRLAIARALATDKPIAHEIKTESGHPTNRQETNDVNLVTDVVIGLAIGLVPLIVKSIALLEIKWTLILFTAIRRRKGRHTPRFVLGLIFLRNRDSWVEQIPRHIRPPTPHLRNPRASLPRNSQNQTIVLFAPPHPSLHHPSTKNRATASSTMIFLIREIGVFSLKDPSQKLSGIQEAPYIRPCVQPLLLHTLSQTSLFLPHPRRPVASTAPRLIFTPSPLLNLSNVQHLRRLIQGVEARVLEEPSHRLEN